jgi:hypothetical protein
LPETLFVTESEDNMKDKERKITAIFLIISSICILLIWLILYFAGQIDDYFSSIKMKTIFLMVSELFTSIPLFSAGILQLRRSKNETKICVFSLGMLLYALLTGIGEFMDRKIYSVTVLFSIVIIATIAISYVNIRENVKHD